VSEKSRVSCSASLAVPRSNGESERSYIAPGRHSYRTSILSFRPGDGVFYVSPDFFMPDRDNSANEKFRAVVPIGTIRKFSPRAD
jgi:hypothetical protein